MVFKIEKYMENKDSSNMIKEFLKETLNDYDIDIYTSNGKTITVPNNYHFKETDELLIFYSNDNIEEIIVYKDVIIGMKKKHY